MQSRRASLRLALASALALGAAQASANSAGAAQAAPLQRLQPSPSRPSLSVWRRRPPGFVPTPADEARLAAAQAKRERRAARNLRGEA